MKLRLPSPAMVVAIIALLVATAGTATAAGVLITSSKQVKANSIDPTDIKNTLTGADVKNGTLSANDLKAGAITAKAIKGGAVGTDQLSGAVRSALGAKSNVGFNATEVVRKAGPDNQAPGQHRVLTMTQLPPGTYMILAKSTLSPIAQSQGLGELLNPDKTAAGQCILEAGGDQDNARAPIATPGTFTPSTINNQLTRTIDAPIDVTLTCDVSNINWKASDSSIIALKLNGSSRTDATG